MGSRNQYSNVKYGFGFVTDIDYTEISGGLVI